MDELLRRLQEQDDILAIMRLRSWYAECADAKYTDDHRKKSSEELEKIVAQQGLFFTEDADWFARPFAVAKGRAAISEYFRALPFAFTMHLYLNPQIGVSGDVATGKGVIWMLGSEGGLKKPIHRLGYTFDEYRKIDGAWLFSKVDLYLKFNVPFAEPWTLPEAK